MATPDWVSTHTLVRTLAYPIRCGYFSQMFFHKWAVTWHASRVKRACMSNSTSESQDEDSIHSQDDYSMSIVELTL